MAVRPAGQPAPALTIHAADGEQTFTLDQAKETLIAPGTVVADVGGKLSTRTEKTVPKWLTETEVTLKDQKIGEQFLKQFSAGRPVLADIVAATEDDSPVTKKLAIYAVKALGDLSLLTPILSRANDPSDRQSTIVALRSYLAKVRRPSASSGNSLKKSSVKRPARSSRSCSSASRGKRPPRAKHWSTSSRHATTLWRYANWHSTISGP